MQSTVVGSRLSRRMNKPRSTDSNIRRRLMMAALIPPTVVAFIAILLSASTLWQITLPLILQQNTSRAQVIAVDAAENLNVYLDTLNIAATSLSRYPGELERKEALSLYSSSLNRLFAGGAALLSADGLPIGGTSAIQIQPGQDFSTESFFQVAKTRRSSNFSGVLSGQFLREDVVVAATPLLDEGELVGVLIGMLPLQNHDWIKELGPLYAQHLSDVYLVDVYGKIIFSTDSLRIGQSISHDDPRWVLLAERSPRSILLGNGLSSNSIVVSFAPLPSMYWGLIIEEPLRWLPAFLPYQLRVIGPLFLTMLLLLAILLIGIGWVSKPLVTLVQYATNISSGGPFATLEVQGPTELRSLITTFNTLASLLDEQQAALRKYAVQILQSQEDERRRLSRELHDETAQTIFGIVQRIRLCRSALKKDSASLPSRLDELQSLAEKAIDNVRRLSNDLRPAILEDLGLVAAVETLCDILDQELPNTNVSFTLVGDELRLPQELELAIFRIVQECLSNIRKHAPTATKVEVVLRFLADSISISVKDDGTGFELTDLKTLVQHSHLGLLGIQERVRMFGGRINIDSTLAKGTTILFSIPLTMA